MDFAPNSIRVRLQCCPYVTVNLVQVGCRWPRRWVTGHAYGVHQPPREGLDPVGALIFGVGSPRQLINGES